MVDSWEIRTARPDDHAAIVGVLDHFHRTSFVAESSGDLAGFLVGFVSPSLPDEAYVHFAGVHPDQRGTGLGRELYARFIAQAREHDRTVIRAITAPTNEASIAF